MKYLLLLSFLALSSCGSKIRNRQAVVIEYGPEVVDTLDEKYISRRPDGSVWLVGVNTDANGRPFCIATQLFTPIVKLQPEKP